MINPSSQFRCISIGIVAENKSRDTHIIQTWPIELLTELADEVRDISSIIEAIGLDKDGNKYVEQLERKATIPAEWIGENYVRTSPDVRRGEQVYVFQAGDSDKYYWLPMGRKKDLDLRRLETLVINLSADPSNRDTEFDRDNAYVLEVSSHDKHITLSTSDKNGEKAKYVMQFNLAEGHFVLSDNHGNAFSVDSPEHHLKLENIDGSFFELNKKVCNLTAPDSVNINTNKYTLNALASILTKTKSHTENSATHTTETGTYNRTASANTIGGACTYDSINKMPAIAVTGAGGGGASISGNLEHSGGQLTSPNMNIENLVVGTIRWTSASGPMPVA